MPSPVPQSPVIHKCSLKKTQIEKIICPELMVSTLILTLLERETCLQDKMIWRIPLPSGTTEVAVPSTAPVWDTGVLWLLNHYISTAKLIQTLNLTSVGRHCFLACVYLEPSLHGFLAPLKPLIGKLVSSNCPKDSAEGLK